MSKVAVLLVFLTLIASTAGCSKTRQQTAKPPPPEVDVALPLQQEVTDYLEYTGTTAAVETVDILARVKGFLESIHFEPGAKVKRDDLLFVIDPREYRYRLEQANADLAAKKAAMELAEYELKRVKGLFSKSMAAEYEHNTAIANLNSAKAGVQAAEAAVHEADLNLSFTRVTSPIAGRVNRNFIDVGNYVDAEKTILTDIVNDDSIYVYFNVSENDVLEHIRRHPEAIQGSPAGQLAIPAYMGLANDVGFPHRGRIDYGDTRVDAGTGTLRVRAIFPNEKGTLLAGLFARVRVPQDMRRVLLVPSIAIGADQTGRFVLVVGPDNKVEQRPVQLGQTVGRLRVVESGLHADDRVIVNGIQRARPGEPVTPTLVSTESAPASTSAPSGASAN